MKLFIAALLFLACICLAALGGFYVGRQTTSPEVKAAQDETPTPPSVEITAAPAIEPIEQLDFSTKPSEPVPLPVPEPQTVELFAERAAQPIQTLTDRDGRIIKAKVLEVNNQMVKIRREDGVEFNFPISNLSDIDIEFCEYLSRTGKSSNKKTSKSEVDWDAIFGS